MGLASKISGLCIFAKFSDPKILPYLLELHATLSMLTLNKLCILCSFANRTRR
jgi:hypothetical protein